MTDAPDLPRAADLPAWMGRLRDRYLHTETSQFILHGDVYDLVHCAGQVWNMPDFLSAFFAPSGKLVVHYDPGRGIWLPDDRHAVRAARALAEQNFISAAKLAPRGMDKTPQATVAARLREELWAERDPDVALQVLEALLTTSDLPCAVIIHYAELVAPEGPPASQSFNDRTAAARLHRWSLSEDVVRGDNVVLMLASSLADLNRRLTRNPRMGALHVPLPGAVERARFLAHVHRGLDPERGEALTRITAGLQLRQIQDLVTAELTRDIQTQHALPVDAINQRKKEILEQECYGLIEVIDPDHGFEVVGGMEPIKAALERTAEHVRAGRRSQVPMGILFVGPMGTGKSFVAEAFARESGLAAIRLKNFRDRWVGSTEANLEKVLDVIEGLGQILVIIDEGDRSIGGASEGDSGVNSRVIARLKEFMSDPTHRGRIIFVMMTNRPDKLDTDMKRPGRFDLKIPFFAPQNAEERAAIVQALLRRHGIEAEVTEEELSGILEPLEGYAAADLEAVVLLAHDDLQSGWTPEGAETPPEKLTAAYLERAVQDYLPTREKAMVRYMELLAVHEASNRRLLPPRFADIEVDALNRQLREARGALPERA